MTGQSVRQDYPFSIEREPIACESGIVPGTDD
jgi:hypothetical protein